MRSRRFSVAINARGARHFTRGGSDYVSLPSGVEYSITLHNNYGGKCDASVTIDNERVGGWQIDPFDSITIERPSHSQRKFVFVTETSAIARRTGAVQGAEENGVIRVQFRPAKYCAHCLGSTVTAVDRSSFPRASLAKASAPESAIHSSEVSSDRYQSGVTVLGDDSDQRFSTVRPLRDDEIDWNLATTITLRLIVEDREDYVSLSSRSRTPPRVDEWY